MGRTNWAGNIGFDGVLHEPASRDELAALVAGAASVRVLGRGHSFNRSADAPVQVSLAGLPDDIAVDREAMTVSCSGGTTYSALVEALDPHDVALENLASLTDITVAGAVGTATHGSGVGLGNLATAVRSIEFVTSTGDVRTFSRGDEGFEGAVVHVGLLGVVSRVTLDLVPAYAMQTDIVLDVPWSTLDDGLDLLFAAGRSVSFFSTWQGPHAGVVHVKSAVGEPLTPWFEAHRALIADGQRNPIGGEGAPTRFTEQGSAGGWGQRLPHFRPGGASDPELQSELFVAADRAAEAVAAMRAIAPRLAPALLVSETRWVAEDELWLSPQYGQDTLGIHCTWWADADVAAPVAALHEALDPLGARPHWAKIAHFDAAQAASFYPRHADFVALADELDPRGAFRNDWARDAVLGR